MPAPMPLAPPVTTATRPSRSAISLSCPVGPIPDPARVSRFPRSAGSRRGRSAPGSAARPRRPASAASSRAASSRPRPASPPPRSRSRARSCRPATASSAPSARGDPRQRVGRRVAVVVDDPGQHRGVDLGVREAEAAAEHVAEFVVQAGAADRQRGAARARRRAALRRAPRGRAGRRGRRAGRGPGAPIPSLATASVTGLAAGVQSASTQWATAFIPLAAPARGGQREGQLGVVDDGPRQHPRVAAGRFAAVRGDPPDRRHLRARVGGRDGEDRQPGLQRDRLRQRRSPSRRRARPGSRR